ncbi:MAG: NADH-quinone oxidoreductase subunit NuoG [Arenimonas sp.]|nr:NADH-quinone oxidoreductase subunit NuoG [Arenimonas sp.]
MSASADTPQAVDLVTLEINGESVQVAKGSMIIQASDRAGIPVPRFCYHEKLPIAANCRMCLVDVEKTPKPVPACATPVMEGMKVYTQSKRALDAQRNVMEFLLVNHPLDCPICDQGGECELQDVSMGYGRSVSRYVDRKRVVPDEDMGPLVATDMTRCIQCTRCVRFSADVAGTFELGGIYRGENLQIGTFDGKPLMSEISGNVIDVCPVGALTNKVFRYKARAWELTARESIGYHDALGSNLYLHSRRHDVLRAVPRDNEAVNECWLSDRDRYAHEGLYADDRASHPMLKENGQWREASWDEALAVAAAALTSVSPQALGLLAHPASSNEEGFMLAELAKALGCKNIDHRIKHIDFADSPVAEAFEAQVADIENAKTIILAGCNIRHELPLLHQRIHKAVKRGAQVHVINPVDFDFTFALAGKHIVAPSKLAAQLAALGDTLGEDAGAVLILGEIAETHHAASHIRAAARALQQTGKAKLCRIPQGANALGLAQTGVLPADGGKHAGQMLDGSLGAVLLFGIEPQFDFAETTRAVKALLGAKVVACSAYVSAQLQELADVILPIGLLPEVQGTLTNLNGVEQAAEAAGKLPGSAQSGWRVLRALYDECQLPAMDFVDIDQLRGKIVKQAVTSGTGLAALGAAQDGFERISSSAIYRVDAVTRRAHALQSHPLTSGAQLTLHPKDAEMLGLQAGQMAKVGDGSGSAALPVAVSDKVAESCVWIESNYPATAPLSQTAKLAIVRAVL